jgi:hypothetical protein
VRLHAAPFQGSPEPKDEPMAENPPAGAVLDYFVKSEAAGAVAIEIADSRGEILRRYASDDATEPPDLKKIQVTPDWVPAPEPPSASAGMHRFVWDLHLALPKELARTARSRRASGPWAPPGTYTVRLTQGSKAVTQPLTVVRDPRLASAMTDADLVHQYELAREIQNERAQVAAGLGQADTLRKQIAALREKARGEAATAVDALSKSIDAAAGPPLLSPSEEFFGSGDADPTTLRRISSSLSDRQSGVESADAAPTADAMEALGQRKKVATQGLARWQQLVDHDLADANARLATAGLAPLKAD